MARRNIIIEMEEKGYDLSSDHTMVDKKGLFIPEKRDDGSPVFSPSSPGFSPPSLPAPPAKRWFLRMVGGADVHSESFSSERDLVARVADLGASMVGRVSNDEGVTIEAMHSKPPEKNIPKPSPVMPSRDSKSAAARVILRKNAIKK